MYNTQLCVLAIAAVVGFASGCTEEPAPFLAPELAGSVVPSFAQASGPMLLVNPYHGSPDDPPPTSSCAHQVNNEGAFSGWYHEGSGDVVVQRWDRNGRATESTPGPSTSASWPLDMNDRGQVLALAGGNDPSQAADWLFIWNADGSGNLPLPAGHVEPTTPVRMNRLGATMATYVNPFWWVEPPFPPIHDIVTSNFGALALPRDPWNQFPYNTPEAECLGEAIDDLGRVYGRCSIEGQMVHYRWTTRDDATPIPGARRALADVWIRDVNRYGELVGSTPSGPVFWSPGAGLLTIPSPLGNQPLVPVAISDRAVVLLSSDHNEGEMAYPAKTIAFWTRERGLTLLPWGDWPFVAVRDINNQGIIAGCVGTSRAELQAAWWRIN